MCVCVCARACACVCACVRACVCMCVCVKNTLVRCSRAEPLPPAPLNSIYVEVRSLEYMTDATFFLVGFFG